MKRKPKHFPLIYVDIEIAYSNGNKPYIGTICILGEQSEVLFNEYFATPKEITPIQAGKILELLQSNYAVCCDPTTDSRVIKSDVRRCGLKYHTSKVNWIDIQLIEQQISKTDNNRRIGLAKLAHKYHIIPPIRFHEAFSDTIVIKSIFEAQLKILNIDKDHLYKLTQLKHE